MDRRGAQCDTVLVVAWTPRLSMEQLLKCQLQLKTRPGRREPTLAAPVLYETAEGPNHVLRASLREQLRTLRRSADKRQQHGFGGQQVEDLASIYEVQWCKAVGDSSLLQAENPFQPRISRV